MSAKRRTSNDAPITTSRMQTKRRTRPGSEFIRADLSRLLMLREYKLQPSRTVKGVDMTTTVALLDRWKQVKKLNSDSEAARLLKLRQSAVANWRGGTSHANPASAARMAEDCGLDPLAILAAVEADRAHDPDNRRVWARYGRGAFVALLVMLGTGCNPAQGAPMGDESSHYAKRRRVTRHGPFCHQGGRPGDERRTRRGGHRRRLLRVWARSQATP